MMKVPPLFTSGRAAEDFFRWARYDAEIRDPQGQLHFQLQNIEAPQGWSQLAVEIAASRYFRRPGYASKAKEASVRELVDRVILALKTAAHRQKKMFKTHRDLKIFLEEVRFLLLSQRAAFNSPVWFNAGVWEKFKIKSRNPQFAWNARRKKIEAHFNAYERPQVSACFIQSLPDSIEGIFELLKTEARLFKFGSGTGTNFSTLRSRFEPLLSGGTSSGLLSFLEVLDKGAGAIKSGGTTRRAAKMVIVEADHPEILDFIDWKVKEEKKAQALIAAGFESGFEGEAYRTVSGQNANNSVRVTDRFLKAVRNNESWILRRRLDGKPHATLPAQDIWQRLVSAAWSCADPGLQFHDEINRWHTCPEGGEIRASNPCSEYMFLDDSACNLASLNLVKFLNEDGEFDLPGFLHAARILFMAQELWVDHASYPTEAIAQNSHDYRPLGLGFANLGSLLMRLGLAYDSEAGRAWASAITALMSGMAYRTSVEMAAALGPFAGYKKNQKSFLKVMGQHQRALKKVPWTQLPEEMKACAEELWSELIKEGRKKGFRNSQATVIAPTGTIGLLMDCDTTGIEPDFSLVKRKKLAGGGELEIVNQAVEPSLRRLGYRPDQIQKILEYAREKNDLTSCPELEPSHRAVFACATGPSALSPKAHVEMMAAVQPFISGAISKTVNLPADASVEQISQVYFEAWSRGLKSIAVYRDGSKGSQPLSASKTAPTENPFMKCPECGSATELHSGCYRCSNCGFSVGCA